MVTLLQDFRAEVRRLVKDDVPRLTDAEIDSKVLAAVERYSRDRPLEKTMSITGDSTTYEWDLPEFFTVEKVEYPVNYRKPNYLVKGDDWIIYDNKIRFLTITPAKGKTAKLWYTTSHYLTTADGSIPDEDFRAVCQLAASLACYALATFYAQTTDPTVEADTVDYRAKQREYSELASEYERLYKEAILPPVEAVVAATRTRDWDVYLTTGQQPFFHRQIRR